MTENRHQKDKRDPCDEEKPQNRDHHRASDELTHQVLIFAFLCETDKTLLGSHAHEDDHDLGGDKEGGKQAILPEGKGMGIEGDE